MQYRCSKLLLLGIMLALLVSISPSLLAQESTAEPPTPEPPTAEPPTLEPPTLEPPTVELPTSEPPTATEAPSLTATFTETPTLTATYTETPTAAASLTASPTLTPTSTFTATPSLLPSLTPTTTVTPIYTPTALATPGMPDYAAELQQWRDNQGSARQSQLMDTCSTDINSSYAIVAPTVVDNRAVDFYAAMAWALQSGSASPYPIYLCEGIFPLDETVGFFVDTIIYGRGADLSTFYQSNTTTMGGMFTVQGSTTTVELHHVTITSGWRSGMSGAAVKIWSGTLRIYDSKFSDNQAGGGGAIDGGGVIVERTYFQDNVALTWDSGAIGAYTLTADCVRFEGNSAADRAGAIFLVFDATISNSSFIDNTAKGEGNQIYAQGWTVNAQQNWWAVSPLSPLR